MTPAAIAQWAEEQAGRVSKASTDSAGSDLAVDVAAVAARAKRKITAHAETFAGHLIEAAAIAAKGGNHRPALDALKIAGVGAEEPSSGITVIVGNGGPVNIGFMIASPPE